MPGLVEADGIVRVVNPDPYESETARCTPEGVRRPLRLHAPRGRGPSPRSPPAGRGPADDRLRGDEIWPWLALALVGVLMFEQFLANRTAA